MITAWRITKARHASKAFDEDGARLYGSRWSTPGTRMAFASESLSLAILEVLVHLQHSSPLADYLVLTASFPEECVGSLDPDLLPKNWRNFPAPPETREIGDAWINDSSSLILRVPSVIVIHEHNYLINPGHPDYSRLIIGGPMPLDIDPRILRGRE